MTNSLSQPQQTKNCGQCPHAKQIGISTVFYRCSLWGGMVKTSDLACPSVAQVNSEVVAK